MKATEKGFCAICGAAYTDYGHNAEPVKMGERCCTDCNWFYVVPSRINRMVAARTERKDD